MSTKKIFFPILCCIMCIVSAISCTKIDYASAEESDFSINARSSILVDFNSDEVLFEQNADEKVQVASIVKLMTVLITLEEIENGNLCLNEKITASEHASGMGGSQVFIDPYAEYTVEEMLKSTIVASANDASVALAEKISGSEEAFVKKMNSRAKELGLSNTVYVNANGLPEPGQYSTARDVAKLTKEVLKHKQYYNYSTIWMDKLVHPSGRETEVVNTNKLIRYFKGCDSGKTGSTDEAGYCLSASAVRGDMRLIGVVLGAKTGTERFNETSKLLNYGFSNFENKQLVSTNEPISQIEVLKSKTKLIDGYAKEDYFAISQKGLESEYEISIEMNETAKAPIKAGDKIGSISIIKNGVLIKEIDVVSNKDVDAISYKDSIKEIVSRW